MHESKRQNLQRMSGEARYGNLVRTAADFEKVWGLHEDGWALAGDSGGGRSIPIWPEAEFAADCATGRWGSYTPRAIALDDLLRA